MAANMFIMGVFLFTILFPGMVVFGITLQLLTSESKISKKFDETIVKFITRINDSKTEES